MYQLSIIVPSYYEESGIEAFLDNLCERIKTIEKVRLLVVDSGDDQTQAKVLQFAEKQKIPHVRVIRSDQGRALQMNTGANYALASDAGGKGHYLLFLHADTHLPLDVSSWWDSICMMDFKWGFFRVHLTGELWPFRVIEYMMNWRSSCTSIGTGDQCLFVRSDVWHRVGGFKNMPLMEDVELCKRLRGLANPHIHYTPVSTSSRRWEENGIVRTVLLMWGLRLGYFFGVSPRRLGSWYRARKGI